ncbi:MAG: 1-acyl-sn-glycerol-3-phosphate acyltransferase [Clostridia bacterium]|nr:1-acyl-sn-glycerol-3-phosphate acyltransferase [Clostridia bacterium]
MFYFYLAASAALIPISDIWFDVLRESYSWWLVPVLFVGFFLGFILIHAAIVALSIQLVSMKSPQERFSEYYRFIIRISLPLFYKLARVKINNSGLEKAPKEGRFLLVCNHQHEFDPILMFSSFPYAQLAFVGKKEIYSTLKFIAKVMHKLSCIPIDRENDREAVKSIIKASRLIKEDKNSVVIFPEGYCSKTGELLPMRNGAFKIAYKADVPIVVCVLDNTRSIVKNMFRRKTEVEFHVLKTIYPEEFKDLHTNELGEHVYNTMNEALSKLRAKKQ